MQGFYQYLSLYIISNAVAVCMLIASITSVRLARLLFFLLFAWASVTNWYFALTKPEVYLEYANLAFFNFYSHFISGWFSRHITLCVGCIATCQAFIAVSMLLKQAMLKVGATGGIIFLCAIAPLGVGAAFPCTVIMAAALVVIRNKNTSTLLWKRQTIKFT